MNKDFIVIIGLFILIGFAWTFTGGPVKKYEIPKFKSSGIQIEEREETIISTLEDSSIYKNKIVIKKTTSRIKETKADREYIVLVADRRNENPITISGWELRSLVSKVKYTIPKATTVAKSGQQGEDVVLNPQDRAIIITGRSPVGESFRTSLCTGYFEQFQDFFPKLDKNCTDPKDEIGSRQLTLACTDFLETLPRCEMPLSQIPVTLSSTCQEFINTELNYNGCIAEHRNDENFYGDEWRLFLGRDQEIWQDRREIISLFDAEGNIVDTITY